MAELAHITRRILLKGLAATSVATPAIASTINPIRAVTHEDLTRYYAFLWSEFSNLSKEMCVDMHDSMTAHQNGDMVALKDHLTAPPSTRAHVVMRSIGADREALASTPMVPGSKRGQSADERARYHYAEFVKAMNEATSDAHGWFIMAGNRRAYGKDRGGSWTNVKAIQYEAANEPRCPGLVIERHLDLDSLCLPFSSPSRSMGA